MTDYAASPASEPILLTFAEAARLTGKPKAYLKELVDAGQLPVRMLSDATGVKQRVTKTDLVHSGLLGDVARPAASHELDGLIALIREQAARIADLEEYRFQLGAQLGAARERIRSLEQRAESTLHALDGTPASSTGSDAHPSLMRIASAGWRYGKQGARSLQSIAATVFRSNAGGRRTLHDRSISDRNEVAVHGD
jgi:hypothetical protein